ncbi:MAG: cysteine/glutathione ABC transporter permease/ATP-binding protein CydD [Desulfobacteraceae bacterium]|jgi:ATP-binding cassette subfamily C protein CydD|nr:cysteine/glutathione ABC transporter permease/ATP-binding protein CydD [Desulfobacteraceae bacterium]
MEHPRKSSHQNARRWLFKRASGVRFWVLLSVALGLGSGLLLIAQARFVARIVHGAFIEGQGTPVLWPFFAFLVGIIAARSILGWAREAAGFHAGAKIRQEIRSELLAHIVSLGPGYTSHQSSGALTSTVLEHVEGLHDFYAFYLPQLALAVMIPAAIVAFVFPYSWAAGGLLLATAPLIPFFMILVGMGAESLSQRHFQALSRMSAYFLDVLQGISTLKLFNHSQGTAETIARVSNNYRLRTMRVLRVAFLSSAVLEFFSSISIALVAVYLAMSYLGYFSFGLYGKSINLAGGLFILLLAPDFYLPLRELGTHYHARAEAVGAAEEILKIAAVTRLETLNGAHQWVKTDPLHIQLEDIYLAFDGGQRPALQGVSFELRQGEQVAMVGASGAGKSTTLHLLLGFLLPDSGQIRVNGMPLTDMTPDSWRQEIAWIGQNPILFQGTIKENILLGRPQASATQIERAAGNARVLDFARHLPGGLNTPVGEHGFGLSRGQAQRVALARAFLKGAPLLLLDEPAAGLDAENEALVIDALETLSRGRTVLMLTHRLTNIQKMSRILVLEKGCIVEQGTYAELTAEGGRFHRMVNQA